MHGTPPSFLPLPEMNEQQGPSETKATAAERT